MPAEPDYAFGPYLLDMRYRRLVRQGEPVVLADRLVDILHLLVRRTGEVITKQELITAAWKDVAVSDNSLEQAMSRLRRTLGAAPDGEAYIEVLARRGYRFRIPVARSVARESDDALSLLLQPYRVFVEGRAAIETLGAAAVARAAEAFGQVLSSTPDYAPAHIGLANALALSFDATRLGTIPDVTALQRAVHHAREACRLDAGSSEAWATLGFALSRTDAGHDAVAAARRATSLDPDNWRHHIRLAYAAWGEERLHAARQAIRRLPGLGLSHWLAATVHIARQTFDDAQRELEAGAAAQDAQASGGRFASVGLHLLLGLVLRVRGELEPAVREITHEIAASEAAGHLYGRQVSASAWYALAGIRLASGDTAGALAALDDALVRAPAHVMALAATSVLSTGSRRSGARAQLQQRIAMLEQAGAVVDVATARGVQDVLAGRRASAAHRIHQALQRAPDGQSSGWGIPVDPWLGAADDEDWADVLALLRVRAG